MDLNKMKKTAASLDKNRKPVTRKTKRRGGSKDKIVDIRKGDKSDEPVEKDENSATGNSTQLTDNTNPSDSITITGEEGKAGELDDDNNSNPGPQESDTGKGGQKKSILTEDKEPLMRLRWLHELDPGLYKTYKSLPKDNRDRVQTALTGSDHAYLSMVANLFNISLRDLLEVLTGQLRKKYGSKIKELRLREIDMDDF